MESIPETEEEEAAEGAGGSMPSEEKPGEGKETKKEEVEECPPPPPPQEKHCEQPGEGSVLVGEAQNSDMAGEEVDYSCADDQPGEGQDCPAPAPMDVDEETGKPGEGQPGKEEEF